MNHFFAKKGLALLLGLSLFAAPGAVCAQASDLEEASQTPRASYALTDYQNHWGRSAIDHVLDRGYFGGTSATTFSPDRTMTRGMFVTVLGRFSSVEQSSYAGTSFSDVTSGAYYAPYVKWANGHGIVTGETATRFNPDGNITREQLVTILFRYAQKTGNDTTYSTSQYEAFPDKHTVSAYAVTPMQWATSHGIIGGDNGYLRPQHSATRAQVAKIIQTAEGLLSNRSIDTPSLPSTDNAQAVIDLVNENRRQAGLPELQVVPELQAAAAIRAEEISRKFEHKRPDGTSFSTVSALANGENIASGYGSPDHVMQGWMNSQGHRNNILRSTYKGIGVGVYEENGTLYWVQLFTNTSP